MQNHLDGSGRNNNSSNNNNSFSAMLSSDPFGGGGGPPSSHDFTTLTSSNHNGTEFGHLLSNNNNHQHHHHHHHSSHHGNSNNNNLPSPITATDNHSNSGSGGVNSSSNAKPKKPPPPNGKKTKGRVKIKMEFIDNKLRRYTTFSKRKTGIMKKAYELSTLTGTQVMLLVASETGHVYTFATRKLQPMITSEAGKALIQTCLNSPDPPNSVSDTQRMSATGYEETELTYAADPNASDHGDIKDDDSDMSGSSDGGDDQKDGRSGAPLLPLNNGLLPPNFAALFASASAAGLTGATTKGGLSIGLIPSSEIRSSSSRSSLPIGAHHPISISSSSVVPSSSASITITPTSTPAVTLSRIKSEK